MSKKTSTDDRTGKLIVRLTVVGLVIFAYGFLQNMAIDIYQLASRIPSAENAYWVEGVVERRFRESAQKYSSHSVFYLKDIEEKFILPVQAPEGLVDAVRKGEYLSVMISDEARYGPFWNPSAYPHIMALATLKGDVYTYEEFEIYYVERARGNVLWGMIPLSFMIWGWLVWTGRIGRRKSHL